MSTRQKELLAMFALALLMVGWAAGSAAVCCSRLNLAHSREGVDLLTPIVAACGSAGVLVCILHFLYNMAREPLPSAEMQDAREDVP